MFIDNKYKRIYFSIVNRGKNRKLPPEIYAEKHHIVPVSLGGANGQSNLVCLTAREHFICHVLLTKFTEGKNKQKMLHAFWMMCNAKDSNQIRDYKINSTLYGKLKQERSNALKGKQRPQEVKLKIGKKLKGKAKPPFTESHRRNLSEAQKGKAPWNKGTKGRQSQTAESKQKISLALKGKQKSDQTKKLLSQARSGMVNCFDKELGIKVFVTVDEFRVCDSYIGFKSTEYQSLYRR